MKFKRHSDLQGKHALLSASKGHWINYDDDKLRQTYHNERRSARGTDLHDLACQHIRMGVKMPGNSQTINQYVNDCIGFRMSPEVVLFATEFAFGTADAIGFRKEEDEEGTYHHVLRVFDLKTGVTRTTTRQLEIYCAYFCIEYEMNPFDLEFEVRIYQNDEVKTEFPTPQHIYNIMKKTVNAHKVITELREEVYE